MSTDIWWTTNSCQFNEFRCELECKGVNVRTEVMMAVVVIYWNQSVKE